MTAVAEVEIWDTLRPEPPIVGGRYQIYPPGAKRPKSYQRVSNFKRPAADTYNFEQRDKRMVAVGIAAHPDLLLQVAACDPDADKGELDKLCKEAQERAGAFAKANIGKAIHRITQRVDLGETVNVPDAYKADIDAYQATLVANDILVVPEYVERVCVLDEFGIAGQFDRLYQFGSQLFVGDIKTGSVDFGFGEMAVQLGTYSRMDSIYDPATRKHQPMPTNLNQDVGLIVHLPAGAGRCHLYWVDLNAGWEAAQHCLWIRNWRARRDLAEEWRADQPCSNPEVRRRRLIIRIEALRGYDGALDMLAKRWPLNVPTFKQATIHSPDELDQVALAISTIEAEQQVAFPSAADPAETRP